MLMECSEKYRNSIFNCKECDHVNNHEMIDGECSEECIATQSECCVPVILDDFITKDEFDV